jgi:phosphoenolpyruvate synthase/pyruvate phosphate dikinase
MASDRSVDGPLIAWLGEPDCHATLLTGGKAANLSRLAAAYRVPPGFCLTATAYDAAHGAHGGGALADGGAPAIPGDMRDALHDAYARLAERCGVSRPAVAVRSSAIDEDGAGASFAGQHETILNVVGEDALLAAVARCWRSLHAAGALAYRAERGLTTEGIRLAVLVQQLVHAEAAGVLFTANPVSGNRAEALLTTNYGLGESIVGGLVTPDTYVIQKGGPAGPRIASLEIGDKETMTVSFEGGTREVSVPAALRVRPAVTAEQALDAVGIGVQLEREMGYPVDVELAWQDGRLYLLQCRPITTLS